MSFIGRSRILRSDGVTPLTDDNIHLLAPSALAVGAHESRSARYTYIPTAEVIAGMRQHGFLPMAAAQARTRDAGRAGHTKHMLRFRHVDTKPVTERRVGATFPEIVLLNSHDGTSPYRIMSGMFQLICLNGMVVADRQGAEVRIPHMGDVVRQVIEGSYAVLDGALDAAAAWQGVPVPSPPPARRGPTPALLTDLPPAPNPRTASICHVQLFENSAVKAEPSWRMGNSTATATSSTPPPLRAACVGRNTHLGAPDPNSPSRRDLRVGSTSDTHCPYGDGRAAATSARAQAVQSNRPADYHTGFPSPSRRRGRIPHLHHCRCTVPK